MKRVLLFFLLLIAVLVGVGYLTLKGKIPVLSNIIFKQVDLGIDESPDTIYSFYDEIGFIDNLKGESAKSGELVFEGSISLEHTFTQQELNSGISAWEESWTGTPFKNMQIKINSDGSIQVSALILTKQAEDIAKTLGYTDEQIGKAKDYLKLVPEYLPIYAQGSLSITNNIVDIDTKSFNIAGVNLPAPLAEEVGSALADVVDKTRRLSDTAYAESAVFTSEGLEFKGTIPASVRIK